MHFIYLLISFAYFSSYLSLSHSHNHQHGYKMLLDAGGTFSPLPYTPMQTSTLLLQGVCWTGCCTGDYTFLCFSSVCDPISRILCLPLSGFPPFLMNDIFIYLPENEYMEIKFSETLHTSICLKVFNFYA